MLRLKVLSEKTNKQTDRQTNMQYRKKTTKQTESGYYTLPTTTNRIGGEQMLLRPL